MDKLISYVILAGAIVFITYGAVEMITDNTVTIHRDEWACTSFKNGACEQYTWIGGH